MQNLMVWSLHKQHFSRLVRLNFHYFGITAFRHAWELVVQKLEPSIIVSSDHWLRVASIQKTLFRRIQNQHLLFKPFIRFGLKLNQFFHHAFANLNSSVIIKLDEVQMLQVTFCGTQHENFKKGVWFEYTQVAIFKSDGAVKAIFCELEWTWLVRHKFFNDFFDFKCDSVNLDQMLGRWN